MENMATVLEAMELVREKRLAVYMELQNTDNVIWQKLNRIWLSIGKEYNKLTDEILQGVEIYEN